MEEKSQSGRDASAPSTIRFGAFQLDLRAGELRKEGRKIRLPEQPFQILRLLLESPGEAVLREEIRSRLWPNGIIVEFDHSINAAVKRLRDVLGDLAHKPRYIETLGRRGYRFIGEVDVAEHPPVGEPAALISENGAPRAEVPLGGGQSEEGWYRDHAVGVLAGRRHRLRLSHKRRARRRENPFALPKTN